LNHFVSANRSPGGSSRGETPEKLGQLELVQTQPQIDRSLDRLPFRI
jgi:hypothetical protein